MQLVAVNHWPVAIETHQLNHPDARHYCVDLDATRPTDLVPEGRLDLLMASPECTHHSRARGGRPINDQSRMSAWHVVRWCEQLYVRSLIVENVPEFRDWGPLDAKGQRPLKSRKGQLFRAWVGALEAIGYRVEWRVLCAADYGDATTRERLFVIARRDRRPIVWPTPTHSRDGSSDLFGGGGQRWRAAREVIDWTIPGRSIFRRKRPLSPKTMARILAGAERFRWPEPYLVVLRQHMDARSLDDPLPTITAGGTHLGLAQPFVLPQHGGGAPRSLKRPVPTITTDGAHGLVMPVTHAGGHRARTLDQPLPTVTCANRGELAFVVPAFGERVGQAPRVHSLDEPAPTICATGRLNLVEPAPERDVLFRMLQPSELARAMGFSDDETSYEFTGNKGEQTKQIGNAVPVGTAAALVGAVLDGGKG